MDFNAPGLKQQNATPGSARRRKAPTPFDSTNDNSGKEESKSKGRSKGQKYGHEKRGSQKRKNRAGKSEEESPGQANSTRKLAKTENLEVQGHGPESETTNRGQTQSVNVGQVFPGYHVTININLPPIPK